ncbi:MAG: carboxypeptidase-like regulatory domain-containing protein, partial [Flavihumibacter sp.]
MNFSPLLRGRGRTGPVPAHFLRIHQPFYRTVMRISFLYLLLLPLSVQLLMAKPVTAQSIDHVRISLSAKQESLQTVLRKIESKTAFRFMFSEEEIAAVGKVSFAGADVPVSQCLNALLSGTQLGFTQQGKHILIMPKSISPAAGMPAADPISGQVTNSKGEPLSGVTIRVKGADKAVATDNDGKFTLNAPADAVLVFSYVGYASKEVPVGKQTILSVELDMTGQAMNEVVVTALGI